jgi:hypothetical protein
MDVFEIGDVTRQHEQPIIVGARHEMAANHRRAQSHRALERLERLFALIFEGDPDHDGNGVTETAMIDRRMIAADDATFLERLEAAGAGGTGKTDPRRQVDDAGARVGDQNGKDGAIETVKVETI